MTTAAALCGQSLLLSFAGPQATSEVLDALVHTRAAGVILFAHNIISPAQLHTLCHTLQSHAAEHGMPPLLIAVDQEGGVVSRLPLPFVIVASQMAQAATGDVEVAYESARITGRQLRACGINVNFAPVLDINCNPANPVIGTRSFGQDPAEVARFGLAAIHGYQEAGVIACAKHFPGHGDTNIDSHHGLPIISHGRERLAQRELVPFVHAIRAGVPAIMTAHILFPALDSLPATLSKPAIGDLLRRELGFRGLVFTDSLQMQAIADLYGTDVAACMAKEAGVDVVLPLGSLESQVAAAQAMATSLAAGRLPPEAFEQTARRLESVRRSYGITHQLPPLSEPHLLLEERAMELARRSITSLRDADLLPLAPQTRLALIDCTLPRFSAVAEAHGRAELLRNVTRQYFPQVQSLALDPDFGDEELAQAVALAAANEVVLLITREAFRIERQRRLGRMLMDLNTPLIHAAVRGPYDVLSLPDAAARLLTYGDSPLSLRALVEVLAGVVHPRGQLPVDLGQDTLVV